MSVRRKLRLAYVVTHPIQYQSPLLRRLALEPDIDLTVFFASDHSVQGYTDEGFGSVRVKWDIPLLEGYRYEFLPLIRSATKTSFWAPINRGFYSAFKKGKYDAIWLHGYWSINSIFAMIAAKLLGIPLLLPTILLTEFYQSAPGTGSTGFTIWVLGPRRLWLRMRSTMRISRK
jgi:hypothetical protein